MAAHANDEEFVVDCMLSLSNLVTVGENARVFLDKSHLKTVFELLDVYDGNAEVVKFVLITLVRLAADDELSKATAEDGMSHVMRATANFVEDAEVLKLIFELLGQLAFVPSNNRALVSAGGIKVLLNTMETFDDDPELIIKTITTLDNLVSSNIEYASVVLERDGEGLLKGCIDKWSHDPSVVDAGQKALLSIQAMLAQKEKGRTNRAALFARLGEDMDESKLKTERLKVKDQEKEPVEDPLWKYREMLKSGTPFNEWIDGKKFNRKILVNGDFDAVLTRGPKAADSIVTRVALKKIKQCDLGNGSGHMVKGMLSSKKKPGAKAELCFVVKAPDGSDLICGECKTKDDAKRVREALQTVLKVDEYWPHRLISG